MNKNITELKQALSDESTVLFIGSGVSTWSGLPVWNKLLSDLADVIEDKGYCADAVRQNINTQPLIAASYGTYHLTHEEFAEFIRATPHNPGSRKETQTKITKSVRCP